MKFLRLLKLGSVDISFRREVKGSSLDKDAVKDLESILTSKIFLNWS